MRDTAKKSRFVELRAQGKSLRNAAEELGISLQTAVRWDHKLKEQIENLKAMELEALREKYWLTEQARIERLGDQLLRIREQLDKRDLSDIETPKLVDMELKLDAALSNGDARLAHKTPCEQKEAPQVSFVQSSEYENIRRSIMCALEPYPEVREEV
jgi:hypothetical protein